MLVLGSSSLAPLAQTNTNISIAIILMLVGFLALYYGAEWLVEGAVSLANHLNISKVVAGVILVAFGTSAPELFVNSIAAVRGEAGFALSNISGSNLANLLIGFGLCAILTSVLVNVKAFRLDLIFFSVAPIIIFVTMFLLPPLESGERQLPLWSVLTLFAAFAVYLYQTYGRMMESEDEEEDGDLPILTSVGYFVLGIVLLYVGGEMTVRQATGIATALGVPDAILGLTIVALGPSIPDITASVVAARQNETAIAVGNLLGSNIFNVLFVIPMTLLFSWGPLSAENSVMYGYGVVVLASLGFFALVRVRPNLSRPAGIVLITSYLLYIVYRVVSL